MKTLEFGKYCVLGLSPMDDITDLPFRQLCKEFGADLLITEFIASEALNREAEKSYRKMRFTPSQHPIGIQIFGADEDELLRCLDIVEQQEPDFIDINWGCPVRKVAGKGAGSGILKDIPKMLRITEALVKRSHLPVTVKTRLGYDADDKPIVELAERLQDVGIAALSIHGRTKTQMYQGSADWTLIGEVKNPGFYAFDNDKTTLLQALGKAGDMTIYGDRNKVKVLRQQEDGQQQTYVLSMMDAEALAQSPAYILQQNDVVYVQPNNYRKRQAANANDTTTGSFWISAVSVLTTILVLIFK